MKYPNFKEERKLERLGYKDIVGIDEAGRGPLAGPVVAAAVLVKELKALSEIRDSKKLTPKKRQEIYNDLKKSPIIKWAIGRVSEKVIDRINILEATKLAMKRAIKSLERKFSAVDFMIIDGNFGLNLNIAQKSIIKADEKVISCALASIIAKVVRDKAMLNYHKKYPQYGFDKHKGYGTNFHFEMIKKHNPSVIHRATFTLFKK